MSRLYPNQPVGIVSPENARLFSALRRIPGDQTHIWMALSQGEQWRPDWMILHEQRVCYLLVVSPQSLQGDLFGASTADTPGALETEHLKNFFHELTADSDFLPKTQLPSVYGVVLFPNIPQDFLDRLPPNPDVALWGKEMVSAALIEEALQKMVGNELFPEMWLNLLRLKICPETSIPRDMIATPKRRHLVPRHTRQILDLDQEYLVKSDLQMSDEATDAVSSKGKTRLVTGIAGSGKSLVLLYRAALQSRLKPDAHFLTITHNRPLSFDLQARQEKIQPGTSVKWQTFYQWCGRLLPGQLEKLEPWDKLKWLNELRAKHPNLAHLPEDFVSTEVDWIREQAFDEDIAYLTVPRHGRKRPLNLEQRESFLALLTDYRQKLHAEQRTDWTDIVENVWFAMKNGHIPTPTFDHILVDEAQFFPPLWFKMILRCQAPDQGTLFLAADPTQGFLRHRTSWRDSGIEVRGHSTRLRKGYRNCREILAFAAAFYRRRLPDLDKDNNLPEPSDLEGLPAGEHPVFIPVDHQQDEITCVAKEILQTLEKGQNAASLLVLFKSNTAVSAFVERLNRQHGSLIAWDAKQPHQPQKAMVRVATLNSATGLESQAVFLCGLDSLLDEEHKLGLEAGEKEEIVRNNTRQIYMAITRASRQIYIVHRHPRTREVLEGTQKTASQLLRMSAN